MCIRDRYRVLEVAYDIFQLHQMATNMNKNRTCYWRPFGQQQPRLVADAQLYQMIREGRIGHPGDPEMRDHVTNADASIAPGEDTRMRFVQRDDRSPIDLLVALSMAAKRCLELRMK